jgi:HEAT repeat protein
MACLLAMVNPAPFLSRTADASSSKDVDSLVKDLNSQDLLVVIRAAEEIKRLGAGAKAALPSLAQAIKHPNEVVRLTVIETLSELPKEDAAEVVPILSESLNDKDPMVREAAALALTTLGPAAAGAIPSLIDRLGDTSRKVREGAALALSRIGDGAIPNVVKALLSAKEEGVGSAAADALGLMGAPAVPALVSVLKEGDASASAAASKALANIGEPAVDPLIELLTKGDEQASEIAAETLKSMGGEAVPGLVSALQRRD